MSRTTSTFGSIIMVECWCTTVDVPMDKDVLLLDIPDSSMGIMKNGSGDSKRAGLGPGTRIIE